MAIGWVTRKRMRRLGLACNEPAVLAPLIVAEILPLYEVLVRFGRWDEILAEPDHPEFMVFTRAFRHAARGIAYAAKNDVKSARAEQVCRDDLARLSENGWSLLGLARSLELQQKSDEAVPVEARFQKLWSKADVQITSCCLCQPGS
jgi:hypothetical protein